MKVSKSDNYEIIVHGWGPCFHSDEEASLIQDWIDHLSCREIYPVAHGCQMEDIIWDIGIEYNGTVEFVSDMWTMTIATGVLFKTNEDGSIRESGKEWRYSVALESDGHLAGLAAVYACLKCKQAEINAGMLDDIARTK